jgi:capsular polysaccharide biosynthesis protein
MWLIFLITITTTAASAALNIFVLSPAYESKSEMIITRSPNGTDERLQYNDLLMYEKLTKTYSEIAKSGPVISETISRLGYNIKPKNLLSNLTVTQSAETQIMEIAVQDKDPQIAYMLASTLSEVFIETAKQIMGTDNVEIMENAQIPTDPVKPTVMLNIALTFLIGLVLSFGLIFLLDYIDNTLKTEDDVEKYLAMTVLASIPYDKKRKPRK